jgi:hypothetical protein
MEPNKPVPVEVKVTWRFAWALWWRWMLFSIALGVLIYVPFVILIIVLGAWNY